MTARATFSMRILVKPCASQTLVLLAQLALLLTPVVGLRHRWSVAGPTDKGWLCRAWADSDVRENRMQPYISALYGPGGPGAIEELNRICSSSMGHMDVSAYTALAAWVRNEAPEMPSGHWDWSEAFEHEADKVEKLLPSESAEVHILDHGCGRGDMLDVLVRRLDLSPQQAHCIEIGNYIPEERRERITMHVLEDHVEDIKALAGGELKGFFDVISSWSVFHHIADTAARMAALQSIAKMTKPNGCFLLNDWDSGGPDLIAGWYDVAHWLLYILASKTGPKDAGALDIGTRYESFASLKTVTTDSGFSYERLFSSPGKSPIGAYEAVFRKSATHPFGDLWPSLNNGSLPLERPAKREGETPSHERKRTGAGKYSKALGQATEEDILPEPIWPIPIRRLLLVKK